MQQFVGEELVHPEASHRNLPATLRQTAGPHAVQHVVPSIRDSTSVLTWRSANAHNVRDTDFSKLPRDLQYFDAIEDVHLSRQYSLLLICGHLHIK